MFLRLFIFVGLAPQLLGQDSERFHALDYAPFTGAIATLALDGGRTEIEMGDVNGDGQLDLVGVGDHGSPFVNTQQHGVTVWLGDGAGGWTLVQTGNFGYGGVALGDANGDGLMDVAYGVHHDYSSNDLGDQLLEVALGDGTGAAWTPWDDGLATNGETWGMFGTDFGDIDADGDLDVGSVSFGCCAGVHVYANQGDGTWVQSFGFVGGNADQDFRFADFDGDGNLDALAAHQTTAVLLGDGTGGFVSADGNLPATHHRGVSAGDLDGDGRDELAFVASSLPEVWSLEPGGVWTERTGNLATLAGPAQLTDFADMDGDGRVDLVAFGNGTLAVYAEHTPGSWRVLFTLSTPGMGTRPGRALRAGGDLDHNGFADVALVQSETTGLFSSTNRMLVYAEASVPDKLALRAVAPSQGRVWRGGQARFVDWVSAVPGVGAPGTVDVLLSTAGGAPPFLPLASGAPNAGRAQVVVPAGVSSSDCRVVYVLDAPGGALRVLGPRFTILP